MCREASKRNANDLRADGKDGLLAEAHLGNTLVPTYRSRWLAMRHPNMSMRHIFLFNCAHKAKARMRRTGDQTADTDGSSEGTAAGVVGAVEPDDRAHY